MGHYYNNKYVNKYGSGFDMYGTINMLSIFKGIKIRKSENSMPGKLRELYRVYSNQHLARRIWNEYIGLVVDDVVSGNIVQLGARKDSAIMCVGLLGEKESNLMINGGKYPQGISPMEFEYRVPLVLIKFPNSKNTSDKVVNIPKKKYKLFMDYLKSGKRYTKIK